MQTRKHYCEIHLMFIYWLKQNNYFNGIDNVSPFEKCAEH